MIEIERKFLVKNNDFISQSHKKHTIIQGYLNTNINRTVRIRIKNDAAFITVKGISNAQGMSRFEWEKEIDITHAKQLLSLCEPTILSKTRYDVLYKNNLFEVDVFMHQNEGLIIAEIELKDENQLFEKPSWLGKEVTQNKKYYNSYLSKTRHNTEK